MDIKTSTMLFNEFKSAPRISFNNVNNKNEFSVILSRNNGDVANLSKYSIINAASPILNCVSLCGTKVLRFTKNGITKVKLFEKIYSLSFIVGFAALMAFVSPASWRYTKADVPLNILTRTFGIHHTIEVFYSIFIVSFGNSRSYVDLFKKLVEIDKHFQTSKAVFKRRIFMSVILTVLPFVQTSFTFWLRQFHVQNIGAHLTFLLILLQGAVFSFFIIHIYMNFLLLNMVLMGKIKNTIPKSKQVIFSSSFYEKLTKKFYMEGVLRKILNRHYCWFEIMQIYDKICDCIDLFNNIYCGQVFIMFNSWLLCTLLSICRSLSPTVKYSTVILSDIFLYTCINSRPLFLAKMCELLIREKRRTLLLLLNFLIYGNLDLEYFDQVQTMMELVETRTVEISANVFIVNVPTVMNFAGRAISYTVLMIQYFYMHLFLK